MPGALKIKRTTIALVFRLLTPPVLKSEECVVNKGKTNRSALYVI
jgi:hypothetical protein